MATGEQGSCRPFGSPVSGYFPFDHECSPADLAPWPLGPCLITNLACMLPLQRGSFVSQVRTSCQPMNRDQVVDKINHVLCS